MVRTKSQKDEQIGQLKELIEGGNSFFLVSLAGLPSNAVNSLRASLRAKGARMRVVKNRLARRAAQGSPLEKLDDSFRGPTAVVYHPSEPVGAAKSLFDFAKDHPALKIRAGLIDRSDAVVGDAVKAVADLPSLEQARAMLLCLINTPATQLVRLINTPAGQLARVIDQKVQSGGEAPDGGSGDAGAADAAPEGDASAGDAPAEN